MAAQTLIHPTLLSFRKDRPGQSRIAPVVCLAVRTIQAETFFIGKDGPAPGKGASHCQTFRPLEAKANMSLIQFVAGLDVAVVQKITWRQRLLHSSHGNV